MEMTPLAIETRMRETLGEPKLQKGDVVIVTPPRGLEYRAEIDETLHVGLFGQKIEPAKLRIKPLSAAFTSGRAASFRARWVSARSVRLTELVKRQTSGQDLRAPTSSG